MSQKEKTMRNEVNPRLVQPGEGRRFGVAGGIYTIKATNDDTGGAYAMLEMLIPPQSGPPPHVHSREVESFYILEGSLSFWLSGCKHTGSAGSLVIAPPGLTHTFKNEGIVPARVLMLITPAGLEDFFQEIGSPIKEDLDFPEQFTSGDIERLATTASKYGIEIKLA